MAYALELSAHGSSPNRFNDSFCCAPLHKTIGVVCGIIGMHFVDMHVYSVICGSVRYYTTAVLNKVATKFSASQWCMARRKPKLDWIKKILADSGDRAERAVEAPLRLVRGLKLVSSGPGLNDDRPRLRPGNVRLLSLSRQMTAQEDCGLESEGSVQRGKSDLGHWGAYRADWEGTLR
jgi:hypothetical protein